MNVGGRFSILSCWAEGLPIGLDATQIASLCDASAGAHHVASLLCHDGGPHVWGQRALRLQGDPDRRHPLPAMIVDEPLEFMALEPENQIAIPRFFHGGDLTPIMGFGIYVGKVILILDVAELARRLDALDKASRSSASC